MMVSPNYYYDQHLKGKSLEEIRTEIQKLKEEMCDLRKLIESDETTEEEICPDPEVRLKMNREYLEEAKKALIEAGGEYTASEREKASQEFNEHIKALKKLKLKIDGFFVGRVEYTIHVGENSATVMEEKKLNFREKTEDAYDIDKEYLIEGLQNAYIGEWESEYINLGVLDGESWELEFVFSDGCGPRTFRGSNTWPWNWDDMADALQIREDEL